MKNENNSGTFDCQRQWITLTKETADSIVELCSIMKRLYQMLVFVAVCSGTAAGFGLLWMITQTISWLTA